MLIARRSFLPETAVLELTYRCNHSCRFCSCPWYAGMMPIEREMNVDEWKACIKELCSAGINVLSFTGGEMLLKEDWEEIVRFAAEQDVYSIALEPDENGEEHLIEIIKKPELVLLSNGKLMNDHVLDVCKELNASLSMSLPGLKAFPRLTCGGMTANHVLNWFTRAKEKGITTTAGITVTAENFDELYETVAQALLAGASQILMNRFLPGGRGLKHRELDLTLEQIAAIPVIVDDVLKTAGRYGSIGTEYPYCVASYALEEVGLKNLSLSTSCGAAKSFFVISPAGNIRVCNHSPRELCHWSDWESLAKNPYWQNYIEDKNLPDECLPCPHKYRCSGGCREAAHVCYGSTKALDPALSEDSIAN